MTVVIFLGIYKQIPTSYILRFSVQLLIYLWTVLHKRTNIEPSGMEVYKTALMHPYSLPIDHQQKAVSSRSLPSWCS